MKLSQLKLELNKVQDLQFVLPNGKKIPQHFHVTELGEITKLFIDCGGKVRKERVVNFQLWEAEDFEHRLAPTKLIDIIALSEKVLGIEDLEVELEYQSETIGKYGLEFNGKQFLLLNKQTACLAEDSCGIPPEKRKVKLSDLQQSPSSCCTPGGSCC